MKDFIEKNKEWIEKEGGRPVDLDNADYDCHKSEHDGCNCPNCKVLSKTSD